MADLVQENKLKIISHRAESRFAHSQWDGVTLLRRLSMAWRKPRISPAPVTFHSCALWEQPIRMMTSSNGNIFRVTGACWGEFTGDRWIPLTKPVTRSFDIFFDPRLSGWANHRDVDNLRRHCPYHDVNVMEINIQKFSKMILLVRVFIHQACSAVYSYARCLIILSNHFIEIYEINFSQSGLFIFWGGSENGACCMW